jgi:hypothetical protein
MFEPPLGLLTSDYVADKARRGADFGLRLTRQVVVRKVKGLSSNPRRSVAGVECVGNYPGQERLLR